MIRLDKIFVTYGDRVVLDDTEFSVPDHDLVALTGQSGSGKTSLLNVLLRQFDHNDGSLHTSLDKDDIVYVDQFATIDPQLKVSDFISLMHEIYHKEIDEESVDKYFAVLKLDHIKRDRIIAHLSTGQKKRLYIACALSLNKRCMIIDEPTSSIDYSMKQILFETLKKEAETKCVLITTHETEFNDLFDIIYRIEDKRLVVEKGLDLLPERTNDSYKSSESSYDYKKIASYRGKKTKRSLLILLVVLMIVFDTIIYLGVASFENQKAHTRIINTAVQNKIHMAFAVQDAESMPYEYPYDFYMELGGKVDLEALEKIKKLDHVTAIYPYYELEPTGYYTRYLDIDDEKSHMEVKVGNKVTLKKDNPDLGIATYYDEDNIIHNGKKIKGNWINSLAAKKLGLSEQSFKNNVYVTLDVGLPSFLNIVDERSSYSEDEELQEQELVTYYEEIYDKKTITLKLDGILDDNDYEDHYAVNYSAFIYAEGHALNKIIQDHLPKKVRNAYQKYEPEYHQRIGKYVPNNYVVYVDSVENFSKVRHGITEANARIMVYTPTCDVNQWVYEARKEDMNYMIYIILFTAIGVLSVLSSLITYHSSHKQKITFFRNAGLNNNDIAKILKYDLLSISIIFVCLSMPIICLMSIKQAYAYYIYHGFFSIIFLILLVIAAVVFNLVDIVVIRKLLNDISLRHDVT